MEIVHEKNRIKAFMDCLKKNKDSLSEMESHAIMLMERKESCEI